MGHGAGANAPAPEKRRLCGADPPCGTLLPCEP